MFTTDRFKCVIPSNNAIKGDAEFSCTGFPPVPPAASEVWAAWSDSLASWAGLILTIILARYAWKAWQEARRANRLTEKQSDEAKVALEKELGQAEARLKIQIDSTESSLQAQIDAAFDLSMRERELSQLQAYCESMMNFVNGCAMVANREEGTNTQFEQRKGDTTIRWAAWSMYMLTSDPELRDASSVLHEHYLAAAENIQQIALQFYRIEKTEETKQLRLQHIEAVANEQGQLFNALAKYVAKLQYISVQAPNHDLHRLDFIGDAETIRARGKAESE